VHGITSKETIGLYAARFIAALVGSKQLSGFKAGYFKEGLMKAFTQLFGIIAIGAVIAAGLGACISITPAPAPSAGTLALRNSLERATWEKTTLASQPPLNNFVKMAWNSEEIDYFQEIICTNERDDGRETKLIKGGVETTIKNIYIPLNTWHALRAPELPGVTYLIYRAGGDSGISILNVYKGTQL
jgi:hypothetical protein